MTSDTSSFEDTLAVPNIWRLSVFQALREQQKGVREEKRAKGDDAKIFVLDLIGEKLKSIDPKTIRGNVTAEKAEIRNVVTQPNPATGGWRLSFELSVKEKNPIELRASLMQGSETISEIWVYRWTL